MNIFKWIGKKSYDGGPTPFNVILRNADTSADITNYHDAVDKSIYVYACLDKNATRIISIGDNQENKLKKYSGQHSWKEILYSTYCWSKLAGYAILYWNTRELVVLDLAVTGFNNDHIDYEGETIYYDQVAIIRNLSPFMNGKGYATLTNAMFQEINTQYNQNKAVERFYEKGMFSQAYATTQKPLTKEQIDLMQEQITSKMRGPENAGYIPIFHGGIDLKTLAMSPDQFKQLANDNVTMEKIAMMFGVPPLLLGRSDAGWGSKDPIYEAWATSTIIPTAESLAEQITDRLFPLIGLEGKFEFDIDGMPEIQNMLLQKAQKISLLYNGGIYTRNEARNMVDLVSIPGEDSFQSQSVMLSYNGGITKTVKTSVRQANKDRVERFAKRFRKPWKSYMDGMRKDFLSKLEKAKTPEQALNIEFDSKFLKIGENIGFEYLPDMYRQAAEATMAAYPKKSMKSVGIEYFDEADPYVVNQINTQIIKLSTTIYQNSKDIVEKQIRSIIATARNEGLGITDIMDRIKEGTRETFDGWTEYRAERIARTESTKANSLGSLEGARQNGMNVKAWLPSGSSKPREEHAAMDPDNWIPIDAFFIVGGEAMYAPGEGSAEQVINCGCSLLYDSR